MEENQKLKLFICYSHLDEDLIKEFIKHISPLRNNDLIQEWYDRKIIAGQDFQNTINNNLDNADIVCLFISANFLNSAASMKEKAKSIELHKKKGISVIPIILSECGWLDDKEISPLLALPTDGRPVSSFSDSNKAWYNVYTGLKAVIEHDIKINKLTIKETFLEFLENAELLTKAHSQKENVILEDIFVYPILRKYDDLGEYEKKESAEKLIEDFGEYSKILIAGEGQSGKTTLCKKLFLELRKKKFVPIYIALKTTYYHENINNKILDSFKDQYQGVSLDEIEKSKIFPIIDDFHLAKHKEKHIQELVTYSHQIVIVDDIFRMNFKNENIIKAFSLYKIKEFSPSLRNELITKWKHLSDRKNKISHTVNQTYQSIDQTTDLINSALGKVFGSGIMPAYPFFILSVISTYEAFEKPLDQEITSQGYCYQALIYLCLRKQGVKNDEIDTYINLLTEFAFYLFKEIKNELSANEFNIFMEYYLSKFNFPINKEILLSKLQQGQIISLDCCNNYSFFYQYIYYYFIAKYLAEHCEENKERIDAIINNLHKNENAYIAIFISHHSKSTYILDEVILNALNLFDKFKPATLRKEELSFFDDQLDIIIKEVLPLADVTPEKVRAERLKLQGEAEESKGNEEDDISLEGDNNKLAVELRRSIKTVEVMGRIIKNRAGSLERDKLIVVFEEAMKVHLRILTSFFVLIQDKKGQEEIVNFISGRLNIVIADMKKKPSQESLKKISKIIFWNTNFSVLYSFIDQIIRSLGSNKLIAIIEEVCDKENTPAAFLVKHGILMWYNKNLQIDNIANKMQENNFSETSKKIMKFIVVNHSSMHLIDYKEKQKIEAKLGISSQRLLIQNIKKSSEQQ